MAELLCAGVALAAACAGSPRRDDPPGAKAPSASASSTRPAVAASAPHRERLVLPSRSETLEPFVLPVPGRRSALVVAADLLRDHAFVRRIDEKGTVGPVRTLAGRHAVAGFDLARPMLLSSDGERLCVEPLDAVEAPRCRRAGADAAVALGNRLALLELVTEKDEDESKKKDDDPPRRRLWVRMVEADGIAADPIDSGLVVVEPLVGMGLIDAASTGAGARIVYYEYRPPVGRGKKKKARAALRSATIDDDGKLVTGSERTLFSGERRYGFVDGHHAPRLISSGNRALYLGRFSKERNGKTVTGFEAIDARDGKGVTAPAAACIADPWRLLDDAPIGPDELAALERIAALSPALVAHQPASDAARVAWAGDSGYYVRDGALHRVSRDGKSAVLPPPFVAERAALSWAELASDGHALALGPKGLVEVLPNGAVVRHGHAASPALHGRPARIGSSWWLIEPRAPGARGPGAAVVRVVPQLHEQQALSASAFADGARLVGGPDEGMFLALAGGKLSVWTLAPDATARALGSHRSPVGPGFEAIARPGGGALVIGPRPVDRGTLVTFSIDAAGTIGAAQRSSLRRLPVALAEHPAGALAYDDGHVAWLDSDGREIAYARSEKSEGACFEGRPVPGELPAAPGHLAPVPRDGCMVSAPLWLADGSVRWLGTAVTDLDSRAQLVTLAGFAPPPSLSASAAGKRRDASPNAAGPACPADMVSIGASLCIDRFEGQLVDAATELPLSPDYATTPHFTRIAIEQWSAARLFTGDLHARAIPLPALLRAPDAAPQPLARSRAGVIPSGYVSGLVAAEACRAAGKRLCTHEEWTTACRGQSGTKFPYGDDYEHGACNVYRYAHPAASLHGNAAVGHLDPRLNRVRERGAPLLRLTGATPRCASRWGDDAVYDMVGNLDEWVDEKGGTFAGAFYSRLSRSGCEAMIGAHPRRYLDYSLGVRCCLSR